VSVAEVDVFLVPGLLFDRAGHRLGRGGGHYDRLLRGARRTALRAGICYAERLVAEVPAEERDVSMDVIVTESEVLRLGAGR
jgi:5-formyltetrahydrofolate cyclo-ligase